MECGFRDNATPMQTQFYLAVANQLALALQSVAGPIFLHKTTFCACKIFGLK